MCDKLSQKGEYNAMPEVSTCEERCRQCSSNHDKYGSTWAAWMLTTATRYA